MIDRNIVFLKIGGSLLSDRNRACTLNYDYILRILPLIRPLIGNLVLVHGMGSFGRAWMQLYDGKRLSREKASLARSIQRELRAFHEVLLDILVAGGIHVRSLDPQALFIVRAGKIEVGCLELIPYMLNLSELPVLYGGTVPEYDGEFGVLSSDQIVENAAISLNAHHVVWATDVPGVYARGRDGNAGKVIAELTQDNRNQVWNAKSDLIDCTGGMASKLESAFRLANAGIPSIFVNGHDETSLEKALEGQCESGTRVCSHENTETSK